MARGLTLDFSDFKEFARVFEQSPQITIRETKIALKKSTFLLEAGSKREAPVDTGRLRSSIVSVVNPLVGTVTPTVKYALSVHEGSKAHDIRPKKAKTLRYKSGGRIVFARKVRHPGTRSNPFMDRALRKGIAGVVRLFDRALERIVNMLANG